MFALIDNLLDSYDKDRYMTMIHMTYKLCIILKRKFPYYRKYNGQIFLDARIFEVIFISDFKLWSRFKQAVDFRRVLNNIS